MNHCRLFAISTTLLLGLATIGCSTGDPARPASYVTVDVQETFKQLNANDSAQIVDVREPGEWATTGVPPGAVLIPLGQLEQSASEELAKDGPVYVICNSGNRSRTGASTLIKLGYAEVYNVEGGIQAWLRAGLPVERYQP
jgi:rhodanese-related sulfurtransferase